MVVSDVTVESTEDEDPCSYWDNFQENWDAKMIFDENGEYTGSFGEDSDWASGHRAPPPC